jgi:hypothetical protein
MDVRVSPEKRCQSDSLSPMYNFLDFVRLNGWKLTGLLVNVVTLIYLIRYAADTRRLAVDTQKLAENSQRQLTFSERPFIALVSSYDEEISAPLVYAHNQGVGPSLDASAVLYFENGISESFGIGCLPAGGEFQFLIGAQSLTLNGATIRYKSMSGHLWRTNVSLSGGSPVGTEIVDENPGAG